MTEYNFLSTVWHTGTTYFRLPLEKVLPSLETHHCCEAAVEKAKEADRVFTTWRDPARVAASWANRGRANLRYLERWMKQWEAYEKLLQLDPVILDYTKGPKQAGYTFGPVPLNSREDTLGVHRALDTGDMETFWEHVPVGYLSALKGRTLPETSVYV